MRLAQYIMFDPVLAADIGGTDTKVGIVQPDGSVGNVATIPTCGDRPEFFVEQLVDALGKQTSSSTSRLGIAVAGFLDARRDRLVYNPNLLWLEGYPLRDKLQKRFGVPVTLEVDSNAAAVAEHRFGAGRGSRRLLCLAAGTGLGAGMVIDGSVLRVAHECIGDAGHVIVDAQGAPCSCGGRGCAEALVGSSAVIDRYIASTGEKHSTLRHIIQSAREGDERAHGVIAETGKWLGIAAASLSHIFFPDVIVICGGLSEAGDLLLEPARTAFVNTAGEFPARGTHLRKAELGWRATLVGAACAGDDAGRSI
jgi:glucokinase